MKCLNCGKDIPWDGHVCPHCHVDKEPSRKATMWLVGGTTAGLAVGYVGYLIGHIWWAGLIGFFVGFTPVMGPYNRLKAQKLVPVVATQGQVAAAGAAPIIKETIREREVVKIKCSHCGSLADQMAKRCSECGAAF